MENIPAFVLGIIVLGLAVVNFFIPTALGISTKPLGIFFTLLRIAALVNLSAGILLLLGGIRNSKNLNGTGFGIGMGGWSLCIIGGILGIFWNQAKLEYYTIYDLLTFIYLWPAGFPVPLTGYTTGIFLSMVHLCLGAISIVIGSIAFGLVVKEKY